MSEKKKPLVYDRAYCVWIEKTETWKPKNIQENVERLLNYFEINPKYNELTKALDLNIPDRNFTQDNKEELELQFVYNLCLKNGFSSISKDLLKAMLLDIGDMKRFHPVRDYLDRIYPKYQLDIENNGITELLKLENTLDTGTFSKDIKHMLIKKWLISCIEAIYCDKGIASQGALILQGPQGSGKTTWFKKLCCIDPEWFKEGLTLNPDNKDSVAIAVSYWICELGEIEGTLKKDLDVLKSYITNSTDVLRRPYAKGISHYPRRTIFCGTVNGLEFLKDDTGNRRFWTIPVIELDLKTKIDIDLLWSEVIYMKNHGEAFWLSPDEILILAESNKTFEAKDYVDTLIESEFKWDSMERFWLRSSDIFEVLGRSKELSSTKIAKALIKRKVKDKTLDGRKYFAVPKSKYVVNWQYDKITKENYA